MQKRSKIVSILLDSLPHIKLFSGSTMVIKYGGAAQINPTLKEQFAIDIVLLYMLGIKPVIVHGGGKKITDLLGKLGIESKFVEGHRITCIDSMKIVEMVLSGDINKEITSFLNHHGVKAVGISGKDSSLLRAEPKDGGRFGYTGEVKEVKAEIIYNLLEKGFVPVIAPVAEGEEAGHPGYNINADTAASEIAKAIKARKVIFLTDTQGVLDGEGSLMESLTLSEVEENKRSGVINGGMIPKVDACVECVKGGVEKAHIIDGRVEHSLLLELFTSEGIGTEILRD
ncbi:acetylglutamate kinase [Wolinella succinogenes]|jgi:acetylglutamate kinase|uniref:Acetylglutamate kinase n=1 Tax=Wolinella succinogenes (strain ATCC 29543 / DSM 1740 / CCUG 13145 / JCM 31913 / LMG 7466 / NCTC 11488 / FDC 602W) TaxID=273121 RepID=ARGB_WOLSU|nr:acetylglutamate kinase [Wolinella succinogenes]Q7M7Q9.1 RecName: Full=Acetylglutamate kinase; AltName: Full=N-acetyl-L-glutamate 5-phosphotransferase; AltName: Full=NAG kinase; Short=NAGK [Wolinella succinogenes DSM 1740]HCZ19195.1 acetylglutamate kinase [Helicobacter sp.]NLU34777.1 acetylglutamate kinase [Wolinella succinogenes]CAE11135.1 ACETYLGLUTAMATE KINASE [Wolinella succinogenes]VEG81301.1 Acetylglutamate kinase [Wolinella succinogenes]